MLLIYIKSKKSEKGHFHAVFMKKVNLYIVFTNKTIKLNKKKIYFMLKIISFLKIIVQSEMKEQLVFNYIPDCKNRKSDS